MKYIIILTGLLLTFSWSCSSDTKNYDNIITEIKKQELQYEKLEKYKIEDFSNTSTIKKLADDYATDRGKGKGLIWAFKTKENLLVFIETKDNGHAGEYGIVYSENGQKPAWNHDEWGEFWTTGEKINDHWWKIYFYLG